MNYLDNLVAFHCYPLCIIAIQGMFVGVFILT